MEWLARGPQPDQFSQISLARDQQILLGRSSECQWQISWDSSISREQLLLKLLPNDRLKVQLHPNATNPLFFQGSEVSECVLGPEDSLVIGETLLTKAEAQEPRSPSSLGEAPFETQTIGKEHLRHFGEMVAERHLSTLAKLPQLLRTAENEEGLKRCMLNVLLSGVRWAQYALVVGVDSQQNVQSQMVECRFDLDASPSPSRKLVIEALVKQKSAVLHRWKREAVSPDQDFTQTGLMDWAFCIPVENEESETTWGIYLSGLYEVTSELDLGSGSGAKPMQQALMADLRFASLVLEMVAAVEQLGAMQQERQLLGRLFPPSVSQSLNLKQDPEQLEPRECNTTILFCDLRGFSRHAEQSAADLKGLLERISQAMGHMTQSITDHHGVIGDFHGDAVMGFWGWPVEQPDHARLAIQAALQIRTTFAQFQQETDHPLADFQVGIGMAFGPTVAGLIGTEDQAKVTAFGPVVNLASRLEGLTKAFRVPIVVDAEAVEFFKPYVSELEAAFRLLGQVEPAGMDRPTRIYELLSLESTEKHLDAEQLKLYESGVEDFISGNWEQAYRILHQMPAFDEAQDLLMMEMVKHRRKAPENWNGSLVFDSK